MPWFIETRKRNARGLVVGFEAGFLLECQQLICRRGGVPRSAAGSRISRANGSWKVGGPCDQLSQNPSRKVGATKT